MLKSKTPSANVQSTTIASLRSITGATQTDAQKLLKKGNWNIERAIDYFYSDPTAQANANASSSSSISSAASVEKKLGQIWEKYKDASSDLITIDGTMELCSDLDIDPENDLVMFCLATDLGSKSLGEWSKDGWVKGWKSISPTVDSLESMKAQLPALRKKLIMDPEYFKKVYAHTFTLSLRPGARTLELEPALSYWQAFIPPALASNPSALSSTSSKGSPSSKGPPAFSKADLDLWCEFMKEKGKAVSKDTWLLFIDFLRGVDEDFKEHDEEAAWPSTIDAFVEYAREKKASA